jgi:hypothetical protein
MSQPLAEVDGTYELQTGEQIVETPFFQDLGIDISAVVGPKKYSASIPKGTTESRTVGRKGLTATKSQQTEVVEKNTEEEKEFNSLIDKARSATSSIKSNAQLKKIFSKAGNDFTNIETDEEEDGLGKTTYKAFVTASDGTLSEEELSKSEYDSLKVFTDEIPSYSSRTGVKIIKARKEEAPAAQPAAGGLPAVQAQAPAAPKIPAEAEGLYKQLGAIEAQEEKISSSEKQNRIKQINKEIESLQKTTRVSSPSYAPAMGVPYSKIPQKKSAAEIKQAITKIEQLVSERDKLEGKTTGKKISPMDQQALDWANANSNDPRARAIKQKLGM